MKYILNIIFTSFFFYSCSETKVEVKKEEAKINGDTIVLSKKQLDNAVIETTTIQKSKLAGVVKANGKLNVAPENMLTISAPVNGFVKSFNLKSGAKVKKGDLLLTLEDQLIVQLQEDFLITKSGMELAEIEYKRQSDLNAQQASSNKIRQQAEAEYTQLKIRFKALAEKLRIIGINPDRINAEHLKKALYIYSPITGYVAKTEVNIGKYVNSADVLLQLINTESIYLTVMVNEKNITAIEIGKPVEVFSNIDPTHRYKAKIDLINKSVDEAGMIEVHCKLIDVVDNLLPGMYMNAEFKIENAASYILPEESVVNFEGKDFVFIANSSNAYYIAEVEIGETIDNHVIIKNAPLFFNKKIVSTGAYTLLMAMKNISE